MTSGLLGTPLAVRRTQAADCAVLGDLRGEPLDLDPHVCVSLVAHPVDEPSDLLGEARYTRNPSGAADLTLVVREGARGRGIGAALLSGLLEAARDGGLDRLYADVATSDDVLLGLLSQHGLVLVDPPQDGVVRVEISTDGQIRGWPPRRCGPRVLIEGGPWSGDARAQAWRDAGADVRHCPGPSPACPRLHGRPCRAIEDADEIVSLLPPFGA